MKKSIALFVYLLFLSIGSYAQRPAAPIKTPKANENPKINPVLITDKSKFKIIDTTFVKIKDLQQKNEALSQELNVLKANVNTLTTQLNEIKVDNFTLKALMKGVDNVLGENKKDNMALKSQMADVNNSFGVLKKTAPIAYGSFEPQKDAGTGGYTFKLVSQYGIKGTPVQSYSSVTITLSQNLVGKPVIVTAAGEDHINQYSSSKTATVIYDFTAPNTIRLTLKGEVLAPFSFAVYDSVQ